MIYLKGHLARPLDAVFSAPSKVAALRVLVRTRDMMSGRAVARRAGINHQGAAVALAGLERLGLVQRREAGRATLWRLDRRRWLVTELLVPLLEREAEHAEEIAAGVKSELRGRTGAALLAGDAAKGKIAAGEPLELVVVEGSRGRRAASEAVRDLAELLDERWGVVLKARVLSKREALRVAALEDLWELLPVEGRPSYFAAGTTAQR